MKAGDDGYGVGGDAKEQGVGESTHRGAPYVVQHHRELQRIVRDTPHRDVKLAAESRAKAASLLLIPVLRSGDLRQGSLGKEDRGYVPRRASSPLRLSQVTA